MRNQQSSKSSDKATKLEFEEFKSELNKSITIEINHVYDRFDAAIDRLERAISHSEDRIFKAIDKSEARLEADRKESENRLEKERKEFKRDRKWMIAIFIALLALIAAALGLLPDAVYSALPWGDGQ